MLIVVRTRTSSTLATAAYAMISFTPSPNAFSAIGGTVSESINRKPLKGRTTAGGRRLEKGKGRDIGYALAASSCEGANNVEYAPSRPLMRSLLSQFQTPTTPRRAVGFFGSGRSPSRPSERITQLTLDWPLFILTNPFSRRRGQS